MAACIYCLRIPDRRLDRGLRATLCLGGPHNERGDMSGRFNLESIVVVVLVAVVSIICRVMVVVVVAAVAIELARNLSS